MRISDWSSDVCSSDLRRQNGRKKQVASAAVLAMLAALLHPDRRPRMEPLQLKPGDWLQIILLAMVWGLSFFLTEICLRDLHPLTVAAGRVTTAAVALMAVALLARSEEPTSELQSLMIISTAV